MKGKGFRKRIAAIVLAASMVLGQAALVSADTPTEQEDSVQEEIGENAADSESEAEDAEVTEETDTEDEGTEEIGSDDEEEIVIVDEAEEADAEDSEEIRTADDLDDQVAWELTNVDTAKGTADIIVTLPENYAALTGAEVVAANQKDPTLAKTYELNKSTTDSRVLTAAFKIKDEPFYCQAGTYVFTLNLEKEDGSSYTAELTQDFAIKGKLVAVQKASTNSIYALKMSGVQVPGGMYASTLCFHVWTKADQSDQKSYTVTNYNETTKKASYYFNTTDFKTYGTYYVTATVKNANRDVVEIANTSFAITTPTVDAVGVTVDNSKGNFSLTTNLAHATAGIKKVQFAVWSKDGQSNIQWYTAKKTALGQYTVSSSISSHANEMGTYQVHTYVTDRFGNRYNCYQTTMKIKASAKIKVASDGTEKTFSMKISDIVVPTGYDKILVAVWPKSDTAHNQLVWYEAKSYGTYYRTKVTIGNHKDSTGYASDGQYCCDVYAKKGDTHVKLGSSTAISVLSTAKVTKSWTAKEYPVQGVFTSAFKIQDSVSGTSKVQIQAYVEGKESSTKHTYDATKTKAGNYTAKIRAVNHDYQFGNYVVSCYVVMGNNVRVLAGKYTYSFAPSDFLFVNKTAECKRTIGLCNTTTAYSKVQYAMWTTDNADGSHADIKWVDASKDSSGRYIANIATDGFQKTTVNLHIYADGKCIKKTTFKISKSEIVKQGWYYENNYWYYYKNGSKQTDLTDIANADSYYIKVDRSRCVVTVYARDYVTGKSTSTGAWNVPIIAFTCSVGLNGATPVGGYKLLQRQNPVSLTGPSYGQYGSNIVGGIWFHSVAWDFNYGAGNHDAVSPGEYNKLGQPASHGCVRLCVRDARWIYMHCKNSNENTYANATEVHIDDNYDKPLDTQYVPKMSGTNVQRDPTDVW